MGGPVHGIVGCPCGQGDACAVDGDTLTELTDSDTAVRHKSDTSGLRSVGRE
ncbi:hypothetical protein [Streptomyces sp. NEAU-L66]|uniref:hypothetical protein n=1 Tax=Streptomyces sp. NEAU-L66 TaxID=3390812 RepID=UPI0039C6011C